MAQTEHDLHPPAKPPEPEELALFELEPAPTTDALAVPEVDDESTGVAEETDHQDAVVAVDEVDNSDYAPSRRTGNRARRYGVWGSIAVVALSGLAYLGLRHDSSSTSGVSTAPSGQDGTPPASNPDQGPVTQQPETSTPSTKPELVYLQSDDPQTLVEGGFKAEENALNTGDTKYLALGFTDLHGELYNDALKHVEENQSYRAAHPGSGLRTVFTVKAVSPTTPFPPANPSSGPRTVHADVIEDKYLGDSTTPYFHEEWEQDVTFTQSVRNGEDPEAVINSGNMVYVWGIGGLSTPVDK